MIGKSVSHYKIIEEIGAGGMGVVYKAEDTKLKRTVALKFLSPQLTRDPESKERFIREAQAASALEHPNICNIHEIHETGDGQMFIVMACYEGETLKEKIKDTRLKTTDAIHIAIQIAQGLEKAHKQGISHRDIKPANIIITTDSLVKILDFGLAKLAGQAQLTKYSSTLGTAAYMSPEQAKGKEVDQRADIWSLGVVLYEMLTSELPFKGDYEQAVLYSILNEDPKPITELQKEAPIGLEKIVAKTLKKNPDERYQNISDLIDDLRVIQNSNESGIAEPDAPDTGRLKIKRPFLYAGFLIIIISIIVGILVYPKIFGSVNSKVVKDADGRISITVLPFKNLTGESLYYDWEAGVQNLLINSLSNSKEISVRQPEIMANIRAGSGSIKSASFSASFASEIALKLETNTFILGNILRAGNKIRISAQLRDASTQEIYKSYKVEGNGEDDIFMMADSLASLIMNFLEIKALEKDVYFQPRTHSGTRSAEAYRYFIQGEKLAFSSNYAEAIKLFQKALAKDSCFVSPLNWLCMSYIIIDQPEPARLIQKRAALHIDRALPYEQLFYKYIKAYLDKDIQGCIKHSRRLTEEFPYTIKSHFALGLSYNLAHQYLKASDTFENLFAILAQIDFEWKWVIVYLQAGFCYHELGQHIKEQQVYELGLRVLPNNLSIIRRQAVCALSQDDTAKGNQLIEKFRSIKSEAGHSVSNIENWTGITWEQADYLEKARSHYRLAIKSVPRDVSTLYAMSNLAYLLIDNEINISEGMMLSDRALEINPENEDLLSTIYYAKGWGYFKLGKYELALENLKKAWDLKTYYDYDYMLHIQEAKKALAGKK